MSSAVASSLNFDSKLFFKVAFLVGVLFSSSGSGTAAVVVAAVVVDAVVDDAVVDAAVVDEAAVEATVVSVEVSRIIADVFELDCPWVVVSLNGLDLARVSSMLLVRLGIAVLFLAASTVSTAFRIVGEGGVS